MTGLGGISFGREIAAAAARHGVDGRLLAAVAAQETGGPESDSGRNIVGDGGHGHGVFQIDDRWHDFASTPAAADPAANADYAAGLLSGLLHRFGGNVRAALSAYNAGSPNATGTVTTWPDGSRLGYADSVLRHLARLGGGGGPERSFDAGTAGGPDALRAEAGLPSRDFLPRTAGQPLQVGGQQPALQPFRSFSSELQLAGAACEDADRRMAAMIDPSAA
jgi:hypothetical protein